MRKIIVFLVISFTILCNLSFADKTSTDATSNNYNISSSKSVIDVEKIGNPTKKQEYFIGDDINLVGLRLQVWNSDMSIEEVDFNDRRIKVTGFDNQKVGEQLVKVYFETYNFREPIMELLVNVKENTNIRKSKGKEDSSNIYFMVLKEHKEPKTFIIGEEIDLSDLQFTVRLKDGTTYVISANDPDFEYNLVGFDFETEGYQEGEISYTYKGYDSSDYLYLIFKENENNRIAKKLLMTDGPETLLLDDGTISFNGKSFLVEYDDESEEMILYNNQNFKTIISNNPNIAQIYYYDNPNNKEKYNSAVYNDFYDIQRPLNIENDDVNYDLRNEVDILEQDIYELDESNIPRKYNLKNIFDIKASNQGGLGLCWDFASTKSLETNFRLKYGKNFDLSERFADYLTSSDFYGSRKIGEGGNDFMYLNEMQIVGVPTEETVPYSNVSPSDYEKLENCEKAVIPEGAILFPYNSSVTLYSTKVKERNMVKEHIMKNGSVYVSVTWAYLAYNSSNNTYYNFPNSGLSDAGHAISIIGWDDDFSKDNFTLYANGKTYKPEHDGAWIALNSWGKNWGFDEGLFYISYDTSMSYFGILNSSPYYNRNIYSYLRKSNNVSYNYDNKSNKKYFYMEFEKLDEIEYLTNIILDNHINNAKYYIVDDYEDINDIDFRNIEPIR